MNEWQEGKEKERRRKEKKRKLGREGMKEMEGGPFLDVSHELKKLLSFLFIILLLFSLHRFVSCEDLDSLFIY